MEEQTDIYLIDDYESGNLNSQHNICRSRTGTIKSKQSSPEQLIKDASHKKRKKIQKCLKYFGVSLLISAVVLVPITISILKKPPVYRVSHGMTSKRVTYPIRTPSTTDISMTTTSFDHCQRKFVALTKRFSYYIKLVAVADFNNDNKTDIIFIDETGINYFIIFNLGNEKFHDPLVHLKSGNILSMVIIDFNDDGNIDIIFGLRYLGGLIDIYLNNGDGTFPETASLSLVLAVDMPNSMKIVDIDNNGRYDIIVVSESQNSIFVFLNTGFNEFRDVKMYSVGNYPMSLEVADLNNDNKPDIVVANTKSNTISILFNNGYGRFDSSISYSVDVGPLFVTIADINNDDKNDIILVNYFSNNIVIYFNNGHGNFSRQTNISGVVNPLSIALNDYDNDSFIDIIVPNYHSNDVVVFFNDRNGSFNRSTSYITYPLPRTIVIDDLNNDEKPDIVVGNGHYVGVILSRCS